VVVNLSAEVTTIKDRGGLLPKMDILFSRNNNRIAQPRPEKRPT